MDPSWKQNGIRVEIGQKWNWKQDGIRMEVEWNQDGSGIKMDLGWNQDGRKWHEKATIVKAVRVVVAMFCFLVRMVGVKLATFLPEIRQKGKEFDEQVHNLGCTKMCRRITVIRELTF